MEPPPPRPPKQAAGLQRAAQEAAARLAGAAPPRAAGAGPAPGPQPALDDGAPLPAPWQAYFDSRRSVACPSRGATFNAYLAGDAGPVVLCLHGGGYTGLTWAPVAALLRGECRVVALDQRGHGATTTTGTATAAATAAAAGGEPGSAAVAAAEAEADLSAETLAADVVAAWAALFGAGPEPPPATVLLGHSMGGAVAVHAAASKGIPTLAGLVVVDVVEGTALASLPFMSTVLARRPAGFGSLRQALEWALSSGMCRNEEAARVALPSMLRRGQAPEAAASRQGGAAGCSAAGGAAEGGPAGPDGGLGALREEGDDLDGAEEGAREPPPPGLLPRPSSSIPPPAREPGPGPGSGHEDSGEGSSAWVWRTPLARSARYWEGWYRGLSTLFLASPVPKVLVLAGTDRLDRELTIGQMQGRFQLVLLPRAGHAVQEDEPGATADAVRAFLRRFRVGLPPVALPRAPPGCAPVLPLAAGPRHAAPPPPQDG